MCFSQKFLQNVIVYTAIPPTYYEGMQKYAGQKIPQTHDKIQNITTFGNAKLE